MEKEKGLELEKENGLDPDFDFEFTKVVISTRISRGEPGAGFEEKITVTPHSIRFEHHPDKFADRSGWNGETTLSYQSSSEDMKLNFRVTSLSMGVLLFKYREYEPRPEEEFLRITAVTSDRKKISSDVPLSESICGILNPLLHAIAPDPDCYCFLARIAKDHVEDTEQEEDVTESEGQEKVFIEEEFMQESAE